MVNSLKLFWWNAINAPYCIKLKSHLIALALFSKVYLKSLRNTTKPTKLRFFNPSISSTTIDSSPISTVQKVETEDTAVCQVGTWSTINSQIIIPKSVNVYHHAGIGRTGRIFSWIDLWDWIIHKGDECHQFFTGHGWFLVVVPQNCSPRKSRFHDRAKDFKQRFSSISSTRSKYIIP